MDTSLNNHSHFIPTTYGGDINQAKEHFLRAIYEVKSNTQLCSKYPTYFNLTEQPQIRDDVDLLEHIYAYGFNILRTKGVTFASLVNNNYTGLLTNIQRAILNANVWVSLNNNNINIVGFREYLGGITLILGYKANEVNNLEFDQNITTYNPLGSILLYVDESGFICYGGIDQKRVYDKFISFLNNVLGLEIIQHHLSDYHFRNLANIADSLTSFSSSNQKYRDTKTRNISDYNLNLKFEEAGNYGRINCDVTIERLKLNVRISNGSTVNSGKVSFTRLVNDEDYIKIIKHLRQSVINNNTLDADYQRALQYYLKENVIPHFITLCGSDGVLPAFQDQHQLYQDYYRVTISNSNSHFDEQDIYTLDISSNEIIDNIGERFTISDNDRQDICKGKLFSSETFKTLLGGLEYEYIESKKAGILYKEFRNSNIGHHRRTIVLVISNDEKTGIDYIKDKYSENDILGIVFNIGDINHSNIADFIIPEITIRGNHEIILYGYNLETMIALFTNGEHENYTLTKVLAEARYQGNMRGITINVGGSVIGSQLATQNSAIISNPN